MLIGRKYYNEQVGLDYIKQLAFLEDIETITVAVKGKFYALSAAAAVSITFGDMTLEPTHHDLY